LIKSFFKRIIISLIFGFFFIYFISKFANLAADLWDASIAGTSCALVYVLSGYFSFYFAFTRNQQLFIRVFIYSLAIRFILVLSLIVVVLKFTNVDQLYFLVIFFIWYFVFQVLEVVSLKNLSRKKA
jgi:hypothetical protein